MTSLNRIVFISSLFVIVLIITFRMLLSLTHLEYASNAVSASLNSFTGILLPLAIVLTLTGTLFEKDGILAAISKVILTLFVALVTLFLMMVSGIGFCGWSHRETAFSNKENPSKTIVIRDFGCGAMDGGPTRSAVFMVNPVAPGLNWTVEVDTLKLDTVKWTSLRDNNQKQP